MSRPLISATLIAKNEAHNVDRCLDSLWPWVDEVVVADTGSTDDTIGVLERYAERKGEPDKLKIVHHEWADDFAAARQAADDAASGRWYVWADFDDTVTGMAALREYVKNSSDDVVAFFTRYRYAADEDGNPISELWRERVVRNNGIKWQDRLHEHKLFLQGGVVQVGPEIAEWVHHRDHTQRTGERNLRILHAWLEDSPDDPRVIQSIAMEYMGEQRFQDAADMFMRYLNCPGEPLDRRAQAWRHMCVQLMLLNRPEQARHHALTALGEEWRWPDTHLTLAEAEQTLGRPDVALIHAQTALSIGKPTTMLIINPLQYTAHPRAIMAICLAQLGRIDEAVGQMEECLQIAPHYPLAVQQMPLLIAQRRKHHAVTSMLASAEMLVEAGEPLKARALLDQAPWYVFDDGRLVKRRGELSELVRERKTLRRPVLVDVGADALMEKLREAA